MKQLLTVIWRNIYMISLPCKDLVV